MSGWWAVQDGGDFHKLVICSELLRSYTVRCQIRFFITALQPRHLPDNTESQHLRQHCLDFIEPAFGRTFRSAPSWAPPGLRGGSKVEGSSAGGWCFSIPTHAPFQPQGWNNQQLPSRAPGRGHWGTYFVSLRILRFSSGPHPCDIEHWRKPLLGWPGCCVETV